jgi:cbb3-type cytochrome c oxidase subunit III
MSTLSPLPAGTCAGASRHRWWINGQGCYRGCTVHKSLYIVPCLALALSQAVHSAQTSAAAELYAQHRLACHGADGRGVSGVPDLADDVWQFGGSPEDIERSITHGRQSTMPALGMALGAGVNEAGLNQVVAYVQSLSGAVDAADHDIAGVHVLPRTNAQR